MHSISRWALALRRHHRGGRIVPGAHRCYPPSLGNDQLKPTTSDLLNRARRFCNQPLGHHLGIPKNNQVKSDQTTNGMDQPENRKEISDVQKIHATADDMWPTGLYLASIIEKSTHRDGAIHKQDWGFWGQGCPIDLADRTETVLELEKFSKALPCYPDQEHCITHLPNEMLQIFSMMLAKTPPTNSGSMQLYGYLAVRDYMDGHLNYVFNRSRDNAVVVQQGSFIDMTGPKRGILMLSEVLIEFDMRIKTGEKEEDDLQLIDGLINLSERTSRRPFTLRFNGSSGGAVDMCLTLIHQGMEVIIDTVISVGSALDLALSSSVFIMEEHKEFQLFHGIVGDSCQKRFVVAVPVDTVMRLKFKACNNGAKNDEVHFCSFDTNQHECVNRQIKFEAACISVQVTVLPPLN